MKNKKDLGRRDAISVNPILINVKKIPLIFKKEKELNLHLVLFSINPYHHDDYFLIVFHNTKLKQ